MCEMSIGTNRNTACLQIRAIIFRFLVPDPLLLKTAANCWGFEAARVKDDNPELCVFAEEWHIAKTSMSQFNP